MNKETNAIPDQSVYQRIVDAVIDVHEISGLSIKISDLSIYGLGIGSNIGNCVFIKRMKKMKIIIESSGEKWYDCSA